MLFESDIVGEYLHLKVGENITFENAGQFKDALESTIEEASSPVSLVIEFDGVDYICSSALGSMIYLFRHVASSGGKVYMVRPCTRLRRVFELVHIPRLVDFVESIDTLPPGGVSSG